ncbi:MAG: hypothetical protein ABI024_05560, partial [Vicinamibacterales bacterium]
MRFSQILIAALAIGACTATSMAIARPAGRISISGSTSCTARDTASSIDWRISDESDARELSRWCRAVGRPVFVAQPAIHYTPPP